MYEKINDTTTRKFRFTSVTQNKLDEIEGDAAFFDCAQDIAECVGLNIQDLFSRSSGLLEFSPIPVRPAVETILYIFDIAAEIKGQRSQCLRLVGRSANLLTAIKKATYGCEDMLPENTKEDIDKFTNLLFEIQLFMQSQANLNWFKRFIMRHIIEDNIVSLNNKIKNVTDQFLVGSELKTQQMIMEDRKDREEEEAYYRLQMKTLMENNARLTDLLLGCKNELPEIKLKLQSLDSQPKKLSNVYTEAADYSETVAFMPVKRGIPPPRYEYDSQFEPQQETYESRTAIQLEASPIMINPSGNIEIPNEEFDEDEIEHLFIEKSLEIIKKLENEQQ